MPQISIRTRGKIKKIWRFCLDLIFPKECLGCNKEGAWLCRSCRKKIIKIKTPYCPKCKKITKNGQFCFNCRKNISLNGIVVSAYYRDTLKEIIHHYKYQDIRGLKKELANLIIKRLKGNLPRGEKIIIPIPLFPQKEKERGFNQAEYLAKIVAANFNLPFGNNILSRVRKTKAQMSLKRKERETNIKGAFKVINPQPIKNKIVLLVDDVTTTGLTLDEAASELKQNGAKEIWGVVIAQG